MHCATPQDYHSVWPLFAGNDSEALVLKLGDEPSSLPPFIITGIRHVKDVPIVETETTSGQPTVLVRIIVEERPETQHLNCSHLRSQIDCHFVAGTTLTKIYFSTSDRPTSHIVSSSELSSDCRYSSSTSVREVHESSPQTDYILHH